MSKKQSKKMSDANSVPRISRTIVNQPSAEVEAASLRITKQENEKLLFKHAPESISKKLQEVCRSRLNTDVPIQLLVISADIRRSTVLMKEAVSFDRFAKTMGEFIDESKKIVRGKGGWFDKFTGDGFLAYWVLEDKTESETLFSVLHTLLYLFQEKYLMQFRLNSRNFPSGIGLSIGVDAGPGYLVTIAGDVTVVGPPVVGAVRMASAAHHPGETLLNVHLGARFFEERADLLKNHEIEIRREHRDVKEYPQQEVYLLKFQKAIGALSGT